MQTISADAFKKKYGEVGLAQFSSPQTKKESSAMERVGSTIQQAGDTALNQITGQGEYAGQSDIQRGVGAFATAFSAPLKVAVDIAPKPIRQGLGYLGEKIGQGLNAVSNALSETPFIKGTAKDLPKSNSGGLGEGLLGTLSSGGQIASDILAYKGIADTGNKIADTGNKIVDTTSQGIQKTKSIIDDYSKQAKQGLQEMTSDQPAKIMQRVARIPKSQQAKFEQVAGESVGEYLSKRGIFGNVDEISSKLYDRFIQSKNTADTALEQLPGVYNPAPVKTALAELVGRESRVSTPGAESQNLARVKELANKFDDQGLTMPEINKVKRLYEANVKVDYLKSASANPEAVVRATNIDSAIRKWQFKQAETLGLKNLGEINRETQLAKNLLNALGKEYAGSAGNNAITLTDWIMLSGGDPSAITGFLVKKGFSSKSVQAALAKFLNKGNPITREVKANIGQSQVLQLPAPTPGAPQSTNFVPPNLPTRNIPDEPMFRSTSKK